MDNDTVAASFMVVTIGASLYPVLCPDLNQVLQSHPSEGGNTPRHLRLGQGAASLLVLAVGVLASYLAKNKTPFIVATITALVFSGAYETVFRMDPR